jgi:hypothetical protein
MISGKSFAENCKWVVDVRYPDRQMFNYASASNNDWVFINGDYIHEYNRRITPFVRTKKFNIIVHNSDRPFTYETFSSMPCVKHVYAINTTFQHPNVTTIPIGFIDKQLPFIESFVDKTLERDIEIYCNFTTCNNAPKRNQCIAAFEGNPKVFTETKLPVVEYYNRLCRSKFVLCPEGTGIDTHRVYESLLCGAIPVVLHNSLSHLYEKLPVCILDKWTDPFYVPENKTFNTDVKHYLW